MNFLKDLIRDEKILEIDADIEDFLEENNISDRAIIYAIILEKTRFKDETEAREFLKSKYFWDYNIEENDTSFVATAISDDQVVITGMKVSMGRDAVGLVGDLEIKEGCNDICFNDKGEVNLSTKFNTINLSEGVPFVIEIARVSSGVHPTYGEISITQNILESMENNFKENVTGVDLAVNEDHLKNEAFGWFKDVFLSFDKQTLYGQIAWNTKGTTALAGKEYRYFSPEFRFNYVHPHTEVSHGATLLGGALTNYPFLKMDAIVELNNKKQTSEEIVSKEQTIDLSVHDSKMLELNTKVNEANAKLEASEAKNIELNSKVEKLEADVEKKSKEAVNQKLFEGGKINAAQLVALNEGKGMLEVLALNETMNVEAKGTSGVDETVVNLSEAEKSLAKKLDLSEEEFALGNK